MMKRIISVLLLFLTGLVPVIVNAQGCFMNKAVSETLGPLYRSCGNPQVDNMMGIEHNVLKQFFGVNCSFFFYDDMSYTGSKNAVFTPEIHDANQPNGTIAFGTTLLNEQLTVFNRFGAGGGIPFIFAHEMGHAKARQMGWVFRRGATIKKDELFADYCAGVFMHYRQYQITTDIQNALSTFFQLGGYAFNDPGFHGTPQERVNAVLAGFNYMQFYKTNFPSVPFTDYTLYTSALNYLNAYVVD